MLSWVHFGDLHASDDDRYESLAYLRSMIDSVNDHLVSRVNFVYLPGDNANNGTPEQFERIRAEVSRLKLPLYAIPGDHDYEPGHLDAFHAFSKAGLPMSRMVNGHRCIFLDVVSAGRGGPDFRLSSLDGNWLNKELDASMEDPEPPVVFMHAYPGDVFDGSSLAYAFARAHVAMVDTGHTHYNELLNDGWVVYAATRSTGQIEEDNGRPGFSVAAIDGGIVSWKFHPYDAAWPFVMITQPADRRLHRSRATPGSPHSGVVRVLVSDDDVMSVVGELEGVPMTFTQSAEGAGIWQAPLPATTANYRMRLTVTAHTADGRRGVDAIEIAPVGATGNHIKDKSALGTDLHAVDAWPEHGILGTQLGPNKNGRHW